MNVANTFSSYSILGSTLDSQASSPYIIQSIRRSITLFEESLTLKGEVKPELNAMEKDLKQIK
jgi:hypothetical protein